MSDSRNVRRREIVGGHSFCISEVSNEIRKIAGRTNNYLEESQNKFLFLCDMFFL